jgi:hypothetical protein
VEHADRNLALPSQHEFRDERTSFEGCLFRKRTWQIDLSVPVKRVGLNNARSMSVQQEVEFAHLLEAVAD